MMYLVETAAGVLLLLVGAGLTTRRPPGRHRRLAAIATDINTGALSASHLGWCPECARTAYIETDPDDRQQYCRIEGHLIGDTHHAQ